MKISLHLPDRLRWILIFGIAVVLLVFLVLGVLSFIRAQRELRAVPFGYPTVPQLRRDTLDGLLRRLPSSPPAGLAEPSTASPTPSPL